MKSFFTLVTIVVTATVVTGVIYYNSKMNYALENEIELDVPQGVGSFKVLNMLYERDKNINVSIAKSYLKINGLDTKLKFGEYKFPPGKTLREVITDLSEGKIIKYKVTIPEGYNLYEVGELLYRNGIIKDYDEFIGMALNKKITKDLLGINAESLEGYLFPSTYDFAKNTKTYSVLVHLVKTFKKNFIKIKKHNTPPPLPLNSHEIVTLASMVEKETGVKSERPLIASVFVNRLKKNMRLQSDPTTIYGKWVETGSRLFNIQKKHLIEKTPYNTYAIPRLPKGPIANPGAEALRSIFNPAKSDYLYFVSKNDGSHYFSKSYKQHNQAVKKFQLKR